jgi:hypothetical protein
MAVNVPVPMDVRKHKIEALHEVILNPKVFALMDSNADAKQEMCELALEALERKFNIQLDVKFEFCEPFAASVPTEDKSTKKKAAGTSAASPAVAGSAAPPLTPASLLQQLHSEPSDDLLPAVAGLPTLATDHTAKPKAGKSLIEELPTPPTQQQQQQQQQRREIDAAKTPAYTISDEQSKVRQEVGGREGVGGWVGKLWRE